MGYTLMLGLTYVAYCRNTVGSDTKEIQIIVHCEFRVKPRNRFKLIIHGNVTRDVQTLNILT